jgi:hypothetical protein
MIRKVNLTGEFYPRVVCGYRSFGEAVGANQRSPRFRQSVADTEYLAHAVLQDGAWSDGEAVFQLSGPKSIRLFVAAAEVYWELIDSDQSRSIVQGLGNGDDVINIRVRSSHGRADRVVEFSRAALMAKYLGKEINRLTVDPTAVYLQFVGTPWQLAFGAACFDPDLRPLLLWWDETD